MTLEQCKDYYYYLFQYHLDVIYNMIPSCRIYDIKYNNNNNDNNNNNIR